MESIYFVAVLLGGNFERLGEKKWGWAGNRNSCNSTNSFQSKQTQIYENKNRNRFSNFPLNFTPLYATPHLHPIAFKKSQQWVLRENCVYYYSRFFLHEIKTAGCIMTIMNYN
jgi:hypothetical protein